MAHDILALSGSPRRAGNSEMLLDSALAGASQIDPSASSRKVILNELRLTPCRSCGFCGSKGFCRFAETDDMKTLYEALDRSDRFIIATPIYFAGVTAQLKTMIDRCQAIWARKYLLKQRHPNPDRRALLLSCGGFRHTRFFHCARQVIVAWCAVMDIKLAGELFYPGMDARGDVEKHPTALAEAREAGRKLMID